jgi:hypothetical protein
MYRKAVHKRHRCRQRPGTIVRPSTIVRPGTVPVFRNLTRPIGQFRQLKRTQHGRAVSCAVSPAGSLLGPCWVPVHGNLQGISHSYLVGTVQSTCNYSEIAQNVT